MNDFNRLIKNPYYREHLFLLESSGVAALDYIDEIETAIVFIRNYSLRKNHKSRISFNLNEISPGKIDLADDVEISVVYSKSVNVVIGSYEPRQTIVVRNSDNKVTDVKKVTITFKCPETVDEVSEFALRRLFYHELTHCKEDVQRRLSGKLSSEDVYFGSKYRLKYSEITDILNQSFPDERSTISYRENFEVCNLLYRIYIDTERNALSNELYADLISIRNLRIKITRENIKDYILGETESGQDFEYFDRYLKDFQRNSRLIKIAYRYFSDEFKKKFKTVNEFRKWFLTFGENTLMSYFKQLCKIGETFLTVENRDYSKSLKLVNEITESVDSKINSHFGYNKDICHFYKKYKVTYREFGSTEKKTDVVRINTLLTKVFS